MKKIALIVIPLVLVSAFLLKKTEVGSYARLGWKCFKKDAQAQVPPEKEIERLRDDLSRLDRHTKKHISAIAEETVAIEDLKAEVVRVQKAKATKQAIVLDLKAKVESGEQYVYFGDHRLSKSAAKDKLAREFSMYESMEKELQAKEAMLAAREEALAGAREQLVAMQDTKRQLEIELEQLAAELKAVRVAQTRSNFTIDDSELSRIKQGIDRVKTRVRVEQKTLEIQGEFDGTPAPAKEKAKGDDLLQRIDAKFGGKVADKK